jgi:two-component system response regulator FixJ
MSSDERRLVHVADDDDAIRRSVSFALKTSGFQVRTYESGSELLKGAPDIASGCILLDIRMPGMDGLEVQEALKAKGVTLPVIIMTGHGDVSLAVRTMKAGAVDFIEKPFQKAVLLGAIEHAMTRLNHAAGNREQAREAAIKLQLLTPRERDVLDGLAKGLPNKSIAYDLGISPRTVEIHRANLMTKLGVNSLSEALRIAFAAEEQ